MTVRICLSPSFRNVEICSWRCIPSTRVRGAFIIMDQIFSSFALGGSVPTMLPSLGAVGFRPDDKGSRAQVFHGDLRLYVGRLSKALGPICL